ncbi:hypothetical protein CYMTET_56617, partial [Cymbomonas tetramitiformis]
MLFYLACFFLASSIHTGQAVEQINISDNKTANQKVPRRPPLPSGSRRAPVAERATCVSYDTSCVGPRGDTCLAENMRSDVVYEQCSEEWTQIENACFKFFKHASTTFLDAEDACQEQGPSVHLATIESTGQNTAAHRLVEGSPAWIGLWSGSAKACSSTLSSWLWTETGTSHPGPRKEGPFYNWITKPWNPPNCNPAMEIGHGTLINCDYDPVSGGCSETAFWQNVPLNSEAPYLCSYRPKAK